MSNAIHKIQLGGIGSPFLTEHWLPPAFTILRVAMQEDMPTMWYMVDRSLLEAAPRQVKILAVHTGVLTETTPEQYIGTVEFENGSIIHYFKLDYV